MMPGDETPRNAVKVTTDERAAGRAKEDVSRAIRLLTANLLRVVRGAGNADDIIEQVGELSEALNAYRKTVGHWPLAYDLQDMISIERSEMWRSKATGAAFEQGHAEKSIVKGALQRAASCLVGQTTQDRAGDSEMYCGIRNLEAATKEARRELVASTKSVPSSTSVRRAPTKRPRRADTKRTLHPDARDKDS